MTDSCTTIDHNAHRQIEHKEGKLWYTDLDSSNGTTYNSTELVSHTPVELTSSGVLILGEGEFAVVVESL